MGNFIKVPLAINPGRSFVTGALNGTATGGGTVSGTGASAAQPIVGGSGSSATATVTKGGDATIGTATITISAIGEGYKVGDVVTIEALTSGGATQWTEDISYTIQADDLVAVEGSDTNPYQLIPIDNVLCIEPVSGVQIKVVTNLWDGTDTKEWTIDVDDAPASKTLYLYSNLSDAINLASQEENSQPSVIFTNDAEVLNVDFG